MKKQISSILCLPLLATAMASCDCDGAKQWQDNKNIEKNLSTEEEFEL